MPAEHLGGGLVRPDRRLHFEDVRGKVLTVARGDAAIEREPVRMGLDSVSCERDSNGGS